ncbi:cholinesterase-like [Asterias amurensis]|uniref:cholinesterase-like n=1 Tax=Asterias amurensis TaxID=7602 RepID=UPI003AB3BEBA
MYSIAVSAGIWLGVLAALVASQPQATVEQGDLFGTTVTFQEDEFINITKNIDVFKGIPFAEPPVGALRFRAPVEKSSWGSEVYNATYFRYACIQGSGGQNTIYTNEDCLYLNIYAPSSRRLEGVPVMVWIHGGAFTLGSGSQPGYDGMPLVAVGDVIVVTLNYRLDILGFLTTDDEASTGNAGLKDQQMAMKWIKNNIAAFGGDSERITIFGESAGSASVSFHILSKMSEGLFSQAIMQSGTAFSLGAFTEKEDEMRSQAFQVGAKLGCSASESAALVDCLREQDALALVAASIETAFRTSAVNDGEFLSDTPANLYSTGQYNHVEILLGSNAEEGTSFLLGDPKFAEYFTSEVAPVLSKDDFELYTSQNLVYAFGSTDAPFIADSVRMQYVDWSQADNETADYFNSFVEFAGDFAFVCPTDNVARIHAQAGDTVFLYQMTQVPTVSIYNVGGVQPGWLGATHAEDLPFVFGIVFDPEFALVLSPFVPNPEKALSVKFMEYWTNFAKTGNPVTEDDIWPQFTIPELVYKELNVDMATGRALKSNQCHFWNTYLVQLRTMLANMDDIEREWKASYSAWKYTDMADWREQFNQYKALTGN